jgi:hypothetical protein
MPLTIAGRHLGDGSPCAHDGGFDMINHRRVKLRR